jgi:RimJ/RimL family protein N-acetyltransferase
MRELRWPEVQPTLVGDGIELRPWSPHDHADVLAACQDPEIQRWTTVPSPYTEHDATFFVEMVAAAWEARLGAPFAATVPDDDRVQASVGIVTLDAATRRAELGYWVAPWARRRGVGTAALRRLSEWATEEVGFDQLELVIDPANVGSTAVAAAAGYTQVSVDVSDLLRAPDHDEFTVHRLGVAQLG